MPSSLHLLPPLLERASPTAGVAALQGAVVTAHLVLLPAHRAGLREYRLLDGQLLQVREAEIRSPRGSCWVASCLPCRERRLLSHPPV